MNPGLLTDGYKTGHHKQYPENTELVYANGTPRSIKYAPSGCKRIVSFGQQMAMMKIHEIFKKDFFSQPKEVACSEIKEELSLYLNTDYDASHFEALHDLGYLPIEVKAIEEGTTVPVRTPIFTIFNTHPDFYWVTNYLETILSMLLWKPMTSATIAKRYREVLDAWQQKTDAELGWFVDWQGHDFSMRGMDSIDAAASSGLAHLLSFSGTDTLPAIKYARKYYSAIGAVGGSVNATEHSVMCAGGQESELDTFRRLMKVYPTGILSVVSDTWDLWSVITHHLPILKDEIMARNGKLVIRPDSGDPVDILCGPSPTDERGRPTVISNSPADKGVIELLWEIFGGKVNAQGFKVLDDHIGAIYGDSITIDRAEEICERLASKGFASTNVVLGIGSFTYQFNTRDSFGFAMKATFARVNGVESNLLKDPVTDDGIKKSATGLLAVTKKEGDYVLEEKVSWEEESTSELKLIYKDGKFFNLINFDQVKANLKTQHVH